MAAKVYGTGVLFGVEVAAGGLEAATLGEEDAEIMQSMADLRRVDCDILTLGQYLRPSRDHVPIARFYTPEEFSYLKEEALRLGFRHVESGPLVRSSYHAHEQADGAKRPS